VRTLLVGCGSSMDKRVDMQGTGEWVGLIRADINPSHHPNVIFDLETLPFPFLDNSFDEIHAYEVLEHTGAQGDWKFFFGQFAEFWRILRPGGLLLATCPSHTSPWAWGDPSHKRIISRCSLVFLDQEAYLEQVGKTQMSDFRFFWKADFKRMWSEEKGDTFAFILMARKPSMWKEKV